MAVVNVKRDPKGTVGPSYTADGARGQKRFTVLLDGTDSADDAPVVAAGASGLPGIFGYWSALEPRLRCIEIHPEPIDGFTLWNVTFQYSTGPESEDPLNEPPDVSDDSMSIREFFDYDRDGMRIANTAGDPIEIEEELIFSVLRIGRNIAAHDFLSVARYRRSVNLRPILGAPAETLWMRDFRSNKVIQATRQYWREELEIVYNHLRQPGGETALNAPPSGYIGWARRVANIGLRVKRVDALPPVTPIIDDASQKGDPISEPVPLNADGTAALAAGANPIWLYFNTKAAVDWAPLGLNLS